MSEGMFCPQCMGPPHHMLEECDGINPTSEPGVRIAELKAQLKQSETAHRQTRKKLMEQAARADEAENLAIGFATQVRELLTEHEPRLKALEKLVKVPTSGNKN